MARRSSDSGRFPAVSMTTSDRAPLQSTSSWVYYLHCRSMADSYLHSTADAADRLAVQNWVIRSLVKRGIWGSGLDTLLTRLRRVIDENGQRAFPVTEFEHAMTALGKSLAFDPTEVDELLEMRSAARARSLC